MNMKDFNAEQAKQIVNSLYKDELYVILEKIKTTAEQGGTVLHVFESINSKTVDGLRDRGFRVIDHPPIAIQRDSLYYSIFWD